MIATLVRTELRLFWRDPWRRRLAAGTAALLLAATWAGLAWQARHQRIADAGKAGEARLFRVLHHERLRAGPVPAPGTYVRAADAGWIAGWGAIANRPVSTVAALATGRAEFVDPAPRVAIWGRRGELTANNEELENPALQAIGRFDLAFAVVVLLPLVAIGLGHDIVARERDAGRWALLASTGVSARRVAFGAIVVRGAIGLVAPLLLAALGFALGGGEFGGATLAWFGVAAAYALTWLVGAALIGTWSSSAGVSLVRGAAVWVGLVVLAPAAAGAMVEAAIPAMTRSQFRAVLAREGELAAADRLATARRFAAANPTVMPVVPRDPDMAPGLYVLDMLETDRRTRAVVETRGTALARREEALATIRWAVPPLLVASVLEDLAGTGAAAQRAYDAAVDAYHAAVRSRFAMPILTQTPLSLEALRTRPRFDWAPATAITPTTLAALAALLGLMLVGAWAMPGERTRERERVFIADGADGR